MATAIVEMGSTTSHHTAEHCGAAGSRCSPLTFSRYTLVGRPHRKTLCERRRLPRCQRPRSRRTSVTPDLGHAGPWSRRGVLRASPGFGVWNLGVFI